MVQTIVKVHGGEIKVVTKEARPDDPRLPARAGTDGNDSVGQAVGRGEGIEFMIHLPLNEES